MMIYTTILSLIVELTPNRTQSLVGGVVALSSLIIGALALGRSSRRGSANGPGAAIAALVLGLIGVLLSAVHLVGSTGFGTGGGRLGALVGLVLGLIGMILGGMTLARARRAHSTN